MGSFNIDTIAKCVGNSFIEKHQDSLVYQWLKKPCLILSHDPKRLNPDSMYYLSCWTLDLIKPYKRFDDCRLVNEIQCIPHYVANLLAPQNYDGNIEACWEDRMFVLHALSILVESIDYDEYQTLAHYIENGIKEVVPEKVWNNDLSTDSIQARIRRELTGKSAIYTRSMKIYYEEEFARPKEKNLISTIMHYLVSPERFSEQIEKAAMPTPHEDGTQAALQARVEALEKALEEKDKEIAALREEKEQAEQADKQCPVCIAPTKKGKVVAVLTAMYYAHYFHSTSLRDKNKCVAYILKHAFGFESKDVSQSISGMKNKETALDRIKEELRKTIESQLEDALTELEHIQNIERELR